MFQSLLPSKEVDYVFAPFFHRSRAKNMCEKSEPCGLLMWFLCVVKKCDWDELSWVERWIDRATKKEEEEKGRKSHKAKKLCKHGTMTTKTLYRGAYCDTSDVPSLSNSVDLITSSPHPLPPRKIYHHQNHHHRSSLGEFSSSSSSYNNTNSLIPFDRTTPPTKYLFKVYLFVNSSVARVFGTPSRGLQTWLFSFI